MAAMTPHLFIELPVGTLFLQYIQSRLVSPPLLLFFPLFFYDSICCQHALYNIYVRMGISLIFKYQLKIFSYHILSYIIFMSIQHLIYVTIYLDQKEKKKKKRKRKRQIPLWAIGDWLGKAVILIISSNILAHALCFSLVV